MHRRPGLARGFTLSLGVLLAHPAAAAVVDVSTPSQLVAAIQAAQAGDVITLAPGTYAIAQNLSCAAAGSASAPIVVRAVQLGDAVVTFDALEGFKVSGPHWTFENLDIRGVCADHSACEHAFHVVGGADFTTLRGNRVRDFNAHVKGNGEDPGSGRIWPDDVLIEGNELFNSSVRQTANPVTPIDVVGGRRWVIRANHIHDHAKGQGDTVSYAAFLKGNSRDGLFERNLVECEKLHAGQVRLGLSFGGGGSSPDPICEDSDCSIEHQGGVMRSNLIANCPADVGIYVNEGVDVKILHNTLIHTAGIDVRFAVSSAAVSYNLLDGQIRGRDGATLTQTGNLASADLASIFTAPGSLDLTLLDGSPLLDLGTPLAEVPDDFCRNLRDDGHPDLGAVEYDGDGPCDTQRTHSAPPLPVDAGSQADAGSPADAAPATDVSAAVDALSPVDAGSVQLDVSSPADAVGALADAGTAVDARLQDAAMGPDRQHLIDAGASADTGSPLDAVVVAIDAGARDATVSGDGAKSEISRGCGCSTANRGDSGVVWAAPAMLLWGWSRRRTR